MDILRECSLSDISLLREVLGQTDIATSNLLFILLFRTLRGCYILNTVKPGYDGPSSPTYLILLEALQVLTELTQSSSNISFSSMRSTPPALQMYPVPQLTAEDGACSYKLGSKPIIFDSEEET